MTKVTRLRVEDIHPNAMNNRTELRRIPELAANMALNGQLDPIIVVKDGNIYRIASGHRRHAAAQHNGWDKIDAIVAADWNEADTIRRLVAANEGTDPLTPEEHSMGVQQMLLLGVPVEDAAASSGETVERVERISRGLTRFSQFAGQEPEQTDLDYFIALAEYTDDDEATARLLAAPQNWQRVIAELTADPSDPDSGERARLFEFVALELGINTALRNMTTHIWQEKHQLPDQLRSVSGFSLRVLAHTLSGLPVKTLHDVCVAAGYKEEGEAE